MVSSRSTDPLERWAQRFCLLAMLALIVAVALRYVASGR